MAHRMTHAMRAHTKQHVVLAEHVGVDRIHPLVDLRRHAFPDSFCH
jgi:hypothetical protein